MPALDYPHILTGNGEAARLERLPRIRVAMIAMDHVGRGWSGEEILRQYPHLTPAEMHSALAYYYDHTPEIDAEIAEELRKIEAMAKEPPSSLRLRLLALRRGEAA
jgi:hypothetical protein